MLELSLAFRGTATARSIVGSQTISAGLDPCLNESQRFVLVEIMLAMADSSTCLFEKKQ